MIDDGRGGTTLRDEVSYELPGGVIGRWLGGPIVRRKLERLFQFRHEVTRNVVTSGVIANNHAGTDV